MTATGWSYQTLYETSYCDVQELLDYWAEEMPTHVVLNLRYFGPSKRRGGKIDEAQARKDLGDASRFLNMPALPLPASLRKMINDAEQMKLDHKGL